MKEDVKFNHFLGGFTQKPGFFTKISRGFPLIPYKNQVFLVLLPKLCVELQVISCGISTKNCPAQLPSKSHVKTFQIGCGLRIMR